MMRSTNGVLRRVARFDRVEEDAATYGGVAQKSLILVGATFVSALASMMFLPIGIGLVGLVVASIATLIVGLVISFNPTSARTLSIPYALGQGLVLGMITSIYNVAYAGIGVLALAVTMAIFLVATVLYSSGIIRVGTFFRKLMFTLLIGSIFASLIVWILSIFNPAIAQAVYGVDSPIALGISAIMVVISSLYVLISLDNVTKIVEHGVDRKYEWYAGFGILINIIWLYMEVLRFLALILNRSRR
jgi:uncharacterized YccA/Bax inhibitor family protein